MKKFIVVFIIVVIIFGTSVIVFTEGDIPSIRIVKQEQNNGTLKRLIHVYLDENIGSANNYRQLTIMLEMLTPSDNVVFKLNSYGGNAYTMIQIYNAIKKTKAHTVADITMAMSAGAIIALACDEIIVNNFSVMMIHSIQTRVGGKISDIKNVVAHDVRFNYQIIQNVFKGFLSRREIKSVINGTEIWLCYDELQVKVNKWYKYKKLNKIK